MFEEIIVAKYLPVEVQHECIVLSGPVWYMVEFMKDGSVNSYAI